MATDTDVTHDSDVGKIPMPGDLILADRRFFVNDYCGMTMAKVKSPPFTRRKTTSKG